MPDWISFLAELGTLASSTVWLPILAWTLLALIADGALRLSRPSPSVSLWARGALLAGLPALLVAPPVLARWVPSIRGAAPASALDLTVSSEALTTLPARQLGPLSPSAPGWDLLIGLGTLFAIASALVGLGVLAGGLLWLFRYRRGLGVASASIQADARTVGHQLGLRQPVDVALAEPASAPFTMGWRHPVVAVPEGLRGEPLQLVLAHEMAHVKHGHFGWHLAERIVRAVFVWHPMVHLWGRELALDRERIADSAVIRLWPERAERYGRLLIAFASTPSPTLALGASSPSVLHRLAAMTKHRPDRRRLARFAGFVVFLVPLLAAATLVPDVPEPNAADEPVQAPLASQFSTEPLLLC